MSKNSTFYECSNCGARVINWAGNCNNCHQWNTFEKGSRSKGKKTKSKTLTSIGELTSPNLIDTGMEELNKVLGDGFVEGSLTLISGEPGVGKSTLLIKVLDGVLKNNKDIKVLYVSGEESLHQLYQRAKRLRVENGDIKLLNTTSWQEVLECQKDEGFNFVLIDSIQTLRDGEINSGQGTSSQVKGITNEILINFKTHNVTTIIIGHKTKDGSIAGPKLLEHMVDTVLNFESTENNYRQITARKNRFGSTVETALYEMTSKGLAKVNEEVLTQDFNAQEVGMSLYQSRKNGRELIIPLQARVIENRYGQGKRVCQGVETNRLSLLIAIIEKSLKINLSGHDIYLRVTWTERLEERNADLSIIMAILSSYYEKVLPPNLYFCGELTLGGQVKQPRVLKDLKLKSDIFKAAQLDNILKAKEIITGKAS